MFPAETAKPVRVLLLQVLQNFLSLPGAVLQDFLAQQELTAVQIADRIRISRTPEAVLPSVQQTVLTDIMKLKYPDLSSLQKMQHAKKGFM